MKRGREKEREREGKRESKREREEGKKRGGKTRKWKNGERSLVNNLLISQFDSIDVSDNANDIDDDDNTAMLQTHIHTYIALHILRY